MESFFFGYVHRDNFLLVAVTKLFDKPAFVFVSPLLVVLTKLKVDDKWELVFLMETNIRYFTHFCRESFEKKN